MLNKKYNTIVLILKYEILNCEYLSDFSATIWSHTISCKIYVLCNILS